MPQKAKSKKSLREQQVLLGVVEHYITTGKPVSSKYVQENGFSHISPATIRNYFVKLEKEGYLLQQHSSGGRAPTPKAYKVYAQNFIDEKLYQDDSFLTDLQAPKSNQIALYLQKASQHLSELTHTPVFLSSPRFDQDFVNDLKVLFIDSQRVMCVLLTDFGLIHTEILSCPKGIQEEDIKDLQHYFNWRLKGNDDYINLPHKLSELGKELYNEVMIRYIVNYSNFTHDDIFSTSFSKLLNYPEFNDAYSLASGLALFENQNAMRSLLKKGAKMEKLSVWIGEDLATYADAAGHCCVLSIPYYIKEKTVGAIALLGPTRMPYRELFSLLRSFSSLISKTLTSLVQKHKINYRRPDERTLDINHSPLLVGNQSSKQGVYP